MGGSQREGVGEAGWAELGEAGWVANIALPYTLSKNPIKLKLS